MDFKKISLLFLLVAGLVNSAYCEEAKDFFSSSTSEEIREFGEIFKDLNKIIMSEDFIDFEKKQLAADQSFKKIAQVYKSCVEQNVCDEAEVKLLIEQLRQLLTLQEQEVLKMYQKDNNVSEDSLLSALLLKRAMQ